VKCGEESVIILLVYRLRLLDVQEGNKDRLIADHVTQIYVAHDRVVLPFLHHVQGLARQNKCKEAYQAMRPSSIAIELLSGIAIFTRTVVEV